LPGFESHCPPYSISLKKSASFFVLAIFLFFSFSLKKNDFDNIVSHEKGGPNIFEIFNPRIHHVFKNMFQLVAKSIVVVEGSFFYRKKTKKELLHLVYSQNLLNFLMDGCHFFYIKIIEFFFGGHNWAQIVKLF
jgi:hypothetical protein